MINTYDVLQSVRNVINQSKHVKINEENIKKAVPLLQSRDDKPWPDSVILNPDTSNEDKIMYLLLLESLNFCYWEKPKWAIEYKDNWYSGSYGLFFGLEKAGQDGYDLLNLDYLNNLSFDELNIILKGTTSIPLLKERYEIIKQLVNEIKKVDNVFELFKRAKSDKELLAIIVDNFENFRDISIYNEKEVYFFKRATLLVNDLFLNIPEIKSNIQNTSGLYGCADYKIPLVLRQLGILEYSNELEQIVDNEQELEHDSEMEIEIRAAMIYAIELIKEELQKNKITMSSIDIDNALWLLSKNDDFKSKSHHLSKTIYY